jgi:cation:H+ antiporter
VPSSPVLLVLAGLVVLLVGGEVLVRGAGGLARGLGMSPLLVGLTVVAAATSAPELAISVEAAVGDNSGLAVGNVVGSNIANVLLVVGVSALILPLAVGSDLVRGDIPLLAVMVTAAFLMSLDGRISPLEGLLLLAGLLAYLSVTAVRARRPGGASRPVDPGEPVPTAPDPAPPARRRRRLAIDGVLTVAGLATLVLGASWVVDGASVVARNLGVSDLVIGLTIVAVGTSLPELAMSIVGVVRGERDLAVGNVVGSGMFNTGAVLGLSALAAGDGGLAVDAHAVRFDMPVMVAAAVALVPAALSGFVIARWEGALLLGGYVAYLAVVVLTAGEQAGADVVRRAALWFVAPLVLLALVTGAARLARAARAPARP